MKPNEVSMLHCFSLRKFVRDDPNLLEWVFQPCHSVFTFYHQVLCHDCSFCFASVSRLVHIFEDSFSHTYFLKPCTHEGTSGAHQQSFCCICSCILLISPLLPSCIHKSIVSIIVYIIVSIVYNSLHNLLLLSPFL